MSNQVIFYGAPGTGKSKRIKDMTINAPSSSVFRTLFHSEYDYADFFGTYKAISKKYGDEEKTKYQFVPGIFLKAYIHSLKTNEPTYLIIEELNRGNCAAIFGEIFQLLDRDYLGDSEYDIDLSEDVIRHLNDEGITITKMSLSSNFYIFATLNTSDQSIFPIDSAFKRRWDWEYVPIDYKDAENIGIHVEDAWYSWSDFIQKMNEKIYKLTESEDKQLGNRFVNPASSVIEPKLLIQKVLFYLWDDVFKNEDLYSQYNVFKYINVDHEIENFTFTDLFSNLNQGNMLLKSFLDFNHIKRLSQDEIDQFSSKSDLGTPAEFYEDLFQYINEKNYHLLDNHYAYKGKREFYITTSLKGIGYYFILNAKGLLSLKLSFETNDKSLNDARFDEFDGLKSTLPEAKWNKADGTQNSIVLECAEGEKTKMLDWAVDKLSLFKKMFDPVIADLSKK